MQYQYSVLQVKLEEISLNKNIGHESTQNC